jgi:hypothetical protein
VVVGGRGGIVTQDDITDLLDKYGIERILEDNQWKLCEILEILEELGYIHLGMYIDPEFDTDTDT